MCLARLAHGWPPGNEILQCVYDRGLNSLTQAQHKILRDAAIRYRARAPK